MGLFAKRKREPVGAGVGGVDASPLPLPKRGAISSASRIGTKQSASTKPRATRRSESATTGDLVGPVAESKADHLRRHSGFDAKCPRCRFYKFGGRWHTAYGTIDDPRCRAKSRSQAAVVEWLAEKPVHLGGYWAVGCRICASECMRPAAPVDARSKERGPRKRKFTKWARYEVVPSQAEHVKQHSNGDAHREAAKTYFEPVAARILQRMPAEDSALLRGAVPQPEHWLSAWASARCPQTWSQMARLDRTQHFINSGLGKPVERRSFQKMARILVEVCRQGKRRELKKAVAIHLSFDEKSPLLHLRYKCTVPPCEWVGPAACKVPDSLASSAESRGKACRNALACTHRTGILTTVHLYKGMARGDFGEDYAVRLAGTITDAIRVFMTPLDSDLDETAVQDVLSKVRALSVDGALLKVAQALKLSSMPSIAIVFRDGAHMIRTALKDPLQRTGDFKSQAARLFGSKGQHGLFKDVQHSDKLKALLQACQERVLEQSGVQGGGLGKVVRDFSFSAIRWESETEPRRRYVCTLAAVALMLADVATDVRADAGRRNNAKACLDAMTSKELFRTGVAGDYAEVCQMFVRSFDVNDGDPSAEALELSAFKQKLDVLFIRGNILCRTAGTSGDAASTLTAIVFEQMEKLTHLRFLHQSLPVWAGISVEDVAVVMADMRAVVNDGIARLDADFNSEELRAAFHALHLGRWLEANRESVAAGAATSTLLRLKSLARRLCDAVGVVYQSSSFTLAVQAAAHELRKLQALLGDHADNRLAWARAVAAAHGKDTDEAKALKQIRPVIYLLLAVNKGTGRVERDLGQLTKYMSSANGGAEGDEVWPALCAALCADCPERVDSLYTK